MSIVLDSDKEGDNEGSQVIQLGRSAEDEVKALCREATIPRN